MEPVLTRVGPYFLDEVIGSGAYGQVKLATHETTKEKVAVKIMSKSKLLMPSCVRNIRSEIRHLKLFIRHPNIIKLYDVQFFPTNFVLIMELAQGSLYDYLNIRGFRIPKREARRFFQQIMSAVDFCHAYNVIHRDIKPSNILLDSENKIKIADFGFSVELEDGKFLNTYFGTKFYKSPEISRQRDYIGPECDIWSCGVVLYVLLYSLQAMDVTLKQFFDDIGIRKFTLPSKIDKHLMDLFKTMLNEKGKERATIKAIRENPWFQRDLDPKLFPPPSEQAAFIVHPEIVQKICKVYKIPEVEVRRALLDGDPNDIQKAYETMLQESQQWQEAYVRDILHPNIENTRKNSQKKTEKWGLGIRIRHVDSLEIRKGLFQVLKQLGFEWSPIEEWQIILRQKYRNTARYNVMSLQVYQSKGNYTLDFRSLGFQIPAAPSPPGMSPYLGKIVGEVSGVSQLPPNARADPSEPSHSPDSSSSVGSSRITIGHSESGSQISIASSIEETHSTEDLRRHEVMEFFEMCESIFRKLQFTISPSTYRVVKNIVG